MISTAQQVLSLLRDNPKRVYTASMVLESLPDHNPDTISHAIARYSRQKFGIRRVEGHDCGKRKLCHQCSTELRCRRIRGHDGSCSAKPPAARYIYDPTATRQPGPGGQAVRPGRSYRTRERINASQECVGRVISVMATDYVTTRGRWRCVVKEGALAGTIVYRSARQLGASKSVDA